MNRIKKPRISPAGRQSNVSSLKDNDTLIFSDRSARHSSTGILSRLARAPPTGNHLTDFVSQMQLIARIANGIALQVGLMDMSLPADDVITELLRMGSMKLNELLSVDFSGVIEVINKSKESSTKLVYNNIVNRFEDWYIHTNLAIQVNVSSKAFKALAGKGEYEGILGKLTSSTVTVDEIETPYPNAKLLVDELEKVDSLNNGSLLELTTISKHLNDVETNFENYANVISLVNTLKDLKKKSTFIGLLIKENQARDHYKRFDNGFKDDQVDANFELFETLSKLFEKNREKLNKFKSLAGALRFGQPHVQYTAGFPNGMDDLDALLTDVDNSNFQKIFNVSQNTSRDIRKGLQPLDRLKTSLITVKKGWRPAKNTVDATQELISEQLKMASVAKNDDARAKQIKEFQSCQGAYPRSNTVSSAIVPALLPIRNLNAKINQLSDFGFISKLTNLTVLKAVVNFNLFLNDASKAAAVPGMLTKLRSTSEVADTITALQQFTKGKDVLKGIVKDLGTTLREIDSKMAFVSSYHVQATGDEFLNWNECLHKHPEHGEAVSDMVKMIRYLRKVGGTQKIADTETFVHTILGSTISLKSAQTVANTMKNVMELESRAFSLLDKSKEVSHTLGMTARGFAAIKKAVDSEKKLGALTGNLSYIQTAASNERYLLSQDEYNGLMDVISLQKDLTSMYTAIGALDQLLSALDETDLKSYTPVFQAAANVPVVNVDVQKLKKAVEALKEKDPSIQRELGKVSTALDVLEPLDLDFASFKAGSPSVALSELNLFFVNMKKFIATGGVGNGVGASTPSANSLASGGSLAAALAASTMASTGLDWVVYAGALGALILGIGLMVVGLLMYRKSKAKKLAEQKEKERLEEIKQKDKEAKKVMSSTLYLATDLVEKMESFVKLNKQNPYKFLTNLLSLITATNYQHKRDENKNNRNKTRSDMCCIVKSAVKLKPENAGEPAPYINANLGKMEHNIEWIVAQAPLTGKEQEKLSTLKEHWMMIDQKNVVIIAQLTSFREPGQNGVFVDMCPQYYPEKVNDTMEYGGFSLKTLEKIDIKQRFTVDKKSISVLKVQFTYRGKKKTVDILRFFGWPESGPLPSNETIIEIIEFCDSYKGTVLVHCSAGDSRSGTLFGVKKGMEMCEKRECGINAILVKLRDIRYNAIQSEKQIIFMSLAITRGLIKKNGWDKNEFIPCYYALLFYVEKIVQDKYAKDGSQLSDSEIDREKREREKFVAKAKSEWESANQTDGDNSVENNRKGRRSSSSAEGTSDAKSEKSPIA